MRAKGTPRLQRIRLVMLLSMLMLGCFLGYWLRSEYIHERESLRKDMSRTLNSVHSQIVDSMIVRDLIRPIIRTISNGVVSPGDTIWLGADNVPTLDSPGLDRIFQSMHTDSGSGSVKKIYVDTFRRNGDTTLDSFIFKSITSAPKRPAEQTISARRIFSFRKDSIGPNAYRRYTRQTQNSITMRMDSVKIKVVQNNTVQKLKGNFTIHDTIGADLVRGIELMIQKMSDLPGTPEKKPWVLDSITSYDAFQKELKKAGISGELHWAPDSVIGGVAGLQLEDSAWSGHTAFVTSYEPNLIRRTSPQLLFSLFLLCLTALAFGMTFRALRSQMQLATVRNDFISNMSHELKTPVSTVKVALEAISEPAVLGNPALAGEYLEMAGLELGRLELLINQSLQTALLEEGRLSVEQQQVDFAQLSKQMLRIMQTRFGQQGGRITLVEEGDSFLVCGDTLHLQGVIVNILDNALKYAGPDPRVEMELKDFEHSLRLRICDHGPGIPPAYRAKIFDKFFRVPKGNEHSVKGYGLGLAYAAQIVRMHGGTITVSEGTGGGCCFEIRLPKQST